MPLSAAVDISKIPLTAQLNAAFSVTNNTLVQKTLPDPKNGVLARIGDRTKADFRPHLEVTRWQDEVGFSIELQGFDTANATVEAAGNIVKLKTPAIEAHYYDLGFDDDTGGFEHEVVFNSKPATNTVQWAIQSSGLRFTYQPPLSAVEIAEGVGRPDDIVGSYAVYHLTKKHNFTDIRPYTAEQQAFIQSNTDSVTAAAIIAKRAALVGKNYRAGKHSHIKRPKITDAANNWVWGDLNIAGGVMTITIPQAFLDSAVYPVIVDPTIGYTTAGGSTASPNFCSADKAYTYTAGAGESVTSVTMYGSVNTGTTGYDLGIYDFPSPHPTNLLGYGSVALNTTVGWYSATGLSISLTNGNTYSIAFGNDGANTEVIYFDVGVSGDSETDTTAGALPSTWSFFSNTARDYSAYATVSSGGIINTVSVVDGIFLDDPTSRSEQHLQSEQLMLNDLRQFIQSNTQLDNLFLSETDYETAIRNVLTIDNLVVQDERFTTVDLNLLDSILSADFAVRIVQKFIEDYLFLYDSVTASKVSAGSTVITRTVVDQLFILDQIMKTQQSTILESLSLTDSFAREQLALAVDNLLTSDNTNLQAWITSRDALLLNDYASKIIQALQLDGLLLYDSATTSVTRYGAILAAIVYAKLTSGSYLGQAEGAQGNFLGMDIDGVDFLGTALASYTDRTIH